MNRRLQHPAAPWVALALLLLGTGALLVHETSGTTFWADDWTWAQERRGGSLGTFLDAHNGHLSLIPVIVYKILFATAGLRSYAPYRAVIILTHLACVCLLFLYARRRIGDLGALLPAALLLLFGPGWMDILWPFQITLLFPLVFGLGALLALDRGGQAGSAGACVLLTLSLASSGTGVAIALGVLLELLLRPSRRREAWVAVVPLVLYGIWSLHYGDTRVVAHGVVAVPTFAAQSLATTFGALSGLGTLAAPIVATPADPTLLLIWGVPLALAGLAVLAWRAPRVADRLPRVIALVTMAGVFWVLTGLTRWFISLPSESRYLYIGATFVLLIGCELAAGVKVPRAAQACIALWAVFALVSNFGILRQGGDFLRHQADLTRAQVAALDIGRPLVKPSYSVGIINVIHAGEYLTAEKALGTPAFTTAELATHGGDVGQSADRALAQIDDLRLDPLTGHQLAALGPPAATATGGSLVRRGSCAIFTRSPVGIAGAPPGAMTITLPPSGLALTAGDGGPTSVSFERFGPPSLALGSLEPGGRAAIRVGADLSPQPWHLQLVPASTIAACQLG